MGNLQDEDQINLLCKIVSVADFGTYEKSILATAFKVAPSQIDPLARLGFVDVSFVPQGHSQLTYYTFNDRWRDLKKTKDYKLLIESEFKSEELKSKKITLEYDLLVSQNKFQKLNNTFIVEQTELIANQKATNDSTRAINAHLEKNNKLLNKIFIGSLIAACLSLGISAWSLYYARDTNKREQRKEDIEPNIKKTEKTLQGQILENSFLKKENDSLRGVLYQNP